MFRNISAILFVLWWVSVSAKVDLRSFVLERTMLDSARYTRHVQYYDGIGRPSVSMESASCDTSANVAVLTEYDNVGREWRQWNAVPVSLPVPCPDSLDIDSICCDFYSDSNPYRETHYDGSPLNRISAVCGPGQNWHGGSKAVSSVETTNDNTGHSCRRYAAYGNSISLNGIYPSGSLAVIETTDEDGVCVQQYFDSGGNPVLERRQPQSGVNADTYFVYDGRGRLCFVLSPELSVRLGTDNASWTADDTDIASLGYVFQYDEKNRVTRWRDPGCAWEYLLYDATGKPVLYQDGNLRENNLWRFTAWDGMGREAYVAVFESTDSFTEMKDLVSQSRYRTAFTDITINNHSIYGAIYGYTSWNGITRDDVVEVSYYDNYSFVSHLDAPVYLTYHNPPLGYGTRHVFGSMESISAMGMLTGKMVKTLGAYQPKELFQAVYYDDRGRVVQTRGMSHLDHGYEISYLKLSFTGKPLEERREHCRGYDVETDIYRYTYDDHDRLVTTSLQRGSGQAVTLSANSYDNVGRLASQTLGGGLTTVSYGYNVRNQVTSIGDGTHFSQTLYYEVPCASYGGMASTPRYNGNVSAQMWQCGIDYGMTSQPSITLEENPYEGQQRSRCYIYSYDAMNRLATASYSDNYYNPGLYGGVGGISFSTGYEYNLNSSPTRITRQGAQYASAGYSMTGQIDDLRFTYDGNRLQNVEDMSWPPTAYAGAIDFHEADDAGDYLWDTGGNMASDPHRGIELIQYNMLNLPEKIQFANGDVVRYVYAADGRKLQVKYKISSVGMVEDPVIGPHSLPSVTGGDGLNGGGSFPGDSIPGGWAGGGTFPGGGGTGGGGIPFPNDTIQSVSSVTEDMEDMANTRLRLDYVGNRVYRNGTLERLGFENGYIDGDGTYCYCLRDWQGNNRVVLAGNDSIIESDNYYPYGQHFTEGAQAAYSAQRWKFGGKEFDAEKGLNWHDFGARFLMPQFGLFTTQDPLRHRNWHLSPYLYCAANPIRFIDPTGSEIRGVSRDDASKVVQDIRAIFPGEEFNQFRNLIIQSGNKQNGCSLAKISDDALSAAFSGISINEDQQAMVDIVVNTINSTSRHMIEYVPIDGRLSYAGSMAIIAHETINLQPTIDHYGGLPSKYIYNRGGGVTVPTPKGTYSAVVNNPYPHLNGMTVTVGHELFGHGRPISLGRSAFQNQDAIQTENLILRLMGKPFVNDGTSHGGYLINATNLPNFR